MNYGSVCSGIEAAGMAWKPLGWCAKFLAEVEPFPAAVLCHRLGATRPLRPLRPEDADGSKDRKLRQAWMKQTAELPGEGLMPNLGDFTKIRTSDYEGSIDLLVGGTPCQSYSIAGLRGGLADPRGNLALEFVRLAYRTGVRWTVWENVPGVLSSGGGSDFAGFLSLLCGWELSVPRRGWGNAGIVSCAPGCFGLAWRVLDAQYTRVPAFPRGIPQRRRRLFVVGYRSQPVGDTSDWRYPAAVLLDGEMRERDTPPGRAASQETPSAAEGGSASADERFALRITGSRPRRQQALTDRATTPEGILVRGVIDLRQAEALDGDVSPTLIATDFKGGKAVCVDVANGNKSEKHRGAHASLSDTSAAPALNECNDREVMPAPDAVESGTGGVLGFIKNDAGSSREGYWADVFPTVRSQVTPAVAMEVCGGDPTGSNHGVPAVRRLLPVECERLMGFPDDWTKIPWIGRPADECPDAPRYRACGNSMCVNVMSWIGRRIDNVEKEMVANAGRTDS